MNLGLRGLKWELDALHIDANGSPQSFDMIQAYIAVFMAGNGSRSHIWCLLMVLPVKWHPSRGRIGRRGKAVLTPGPLIHWEGVLATEQSVGRTAEAGNRIAIYGGREGEDRLNSRGRDRKGGLVGLVTG